MKSEIKAALLRYAQDYTPPGDFLQAVLSNDLMEAMGRADEGNRHDLFEICQFVYNDIPSNCHGSRDIVKQWLAIGHTNK